MLSSDPKSITHHKRATNGVNLCAKVQETRRGDGATDKVNSYMKVQVIKRVKSID